MRILRLIARLNVGGPAQQVVAMTKAFPDSLLLCGTPSGDEGDMSYLVDGRVSYLTVPGLGREIRPWVDYKSFRYVVNVIRWWKPDIIHTHTAKAGVVGRIAGIWVNVGKKRKIKLVHTFHGNVFKEYFGRTKSGIFLRIERVLAHFTDAIVALSKEQGQALVEGYHVGGGNVRIIPLGVDLSTFNTLPDPKFAAPLTVAYVGRLERVKQPETLLKSAIVMLTVLGLGRKIQFKFIGDGPLREELEARAASAGIKEEVTFTGWVKDVSKELEDVDIVVLTSLNEGTPLSAIEAMAARRLVIATGVGGVPDLLGNTISANMYYDVAERGIQLCTAGVDGCLTIALQDILANPGRFDLLRERARAYVMENHSSERLKRDLEILYGGLLNEEKGVAD